MSIFRFFEFELEASLLTLMVLSVDKVFCSRTIEESFCLVLAFSSALTSGRLCGTSSLPEFCVTVIGCFNEDIFLSLFASLSSILDGFTDKTVGPSLPTLTVCTVAAVLVVVGPDLSQLVLHSLRKLLALWQESAEVVFGEPWTDDVVADDVECGFKVVDS